MNKVLELFKDYDRSIARRVLSKGPKSIWKIRFQCRSKKDAPDWSDRIIDYVIDFDDNTVETADWSQEIRGGFNKPSPMNKRQRDKIKKILIKMSLKQD